MDVFTLGSRSVVALLHTHNTQMKYDTGPLLHLNVGAKLGDKGRYYAAHRAKQTDLEEHSYSYTALKKLSSCRKAAAALFWQPARGKASWNSVLLQWSRSRHVALGLLDLPSLFTFHHLGEQMLLARTDASNGCSTARTTALHTAPDTARPHCSTADSNLPIQGIMCHESHQILCIKTFKHSQWQSTTMYVYIYISQRAKSNIV